MSMDQFSRRCCRIFLTYSFDYSLGGQLWWTALVTVLTDSFGGQWLVLVDMFWWTVLDDSFGGQF